MAKFKDAWAWIVENWLYLLSSVVVFVVVLPIIGWGMIGLFSSNTGNFPWAWVLGGLLAVIIIPIVIILVMILPKKPLLVPTLQITVAGTPSPSFWYKWKKFIQVSLSIITGLICVWIVFSLLRSNFNWFLTFILTLMVTIIAVLLISFFVNAFKKPGVIAGSIVSLVLVALVAMYAIPRMLPYSVLQKAGIQTLIPPDVEPKIRNPRWITARPDAWSEEVVFPSSPPCNIEWTYEHPNAHVEVLPDNDQLRVFKDSTVDTADLHIAPGSIRSVRFRSLDPYPVVVKITIKPYTRD